MSLITTLSTKAASSGAAPVTPDTQSVQFNGSDEFISVADTAALDISNNFSIAFWIKGGPQTDYAQVTGKTLLTAGMSWMIRARGTGSPNNTYLEGYFYGNAGGTAYRGFQSTTAVFDGTWHSVVVTYASGTLLYYLDGVLDTTGAINVGNPTTINTNSETLKFGQAGYATPAYFTGNMLYPTVYDTAVLSAGDAAAYHNSGVPKDPTTITYSGSQNIVEWWKFSTGDDLETANGVTGQVAGLDGSGTLLTNSTDLVTDVPPATTTIESGWNLDGSTSLITVPYDASLNVRTNLSVEVVFNCVAADTGANQHIVNRRVSGGVQYQVYIQNSTGWLIFYINQAGSGFQKQYEYRTDVTGGPHQLAFTFDTGTFTVYFDGADITGSVTKSIDDAMTTLIDNTADPVRIGNIEAGSFYFKGKIGRVNIWDTAILSALEVLALYAGGTFSQDPTSDTAGFYTSSSDLVMSLLMESGDTAGTGTVLDSSGNGNVGTTTNLVDGDLQSWS